VPAWVGKGGIDQASPGTPAEPELRQAAAQRTKKFICAYPLPPGNGGNHNGVNVEISEELLGGEPAPSHSRVHDLKKATMPAPDDHEMGEVVGLADDDERRQSSGLGQQEMV
jgi:hypothetical protein